MALLFDHFGVRRVELDVLMWPGFSHGFKPGELSSLYGALNTDDAFESCELRANLGATFDSEHWEYDISTTRIHIAAGPAFQSFDELDKRVLHLIEETKKHLTQRRLPFVTTERAYVMGVVPEDGDRDVSEVVRSKMLSRRLTQQHDGERLLDHLPGDLVGAGITLVGDGEDFHWHANIGPAHGGATNLRISAELYFPPPSEAPEDSMISDSLRTAYEFLNTSVREFAQEALG